MMAYNHISRASCTLPLTIGIGHGLRDFIRRTDLIIETWNMGSRYKFISTRFWVFPRESSDVIDGDRDIPKINHR